MAENKMDNLEEAEVIGSEPITVVEEKKKNKSAFKWFAGISAVFLANKAMNKYFIKDSGEPTKKGIVSLALGLIFVANVFVLTPIGSYLKDGIKSTVEYTEKQSENKEINELRSLLAEKEQKIVDFQEKAEEEAKFGDLNDEIERLKAELAEKDAKMKEIEDYR